MSGLKWIGSFTYGAMGAAGKAAAVVLLVCGVTGGMTRAALAEKVHLLAFGDSLTAGYGLLDHEGFVPVLRDWMAAQGEDVRIVQAGVSGDTTTGGLARLEWSLGPEIQGIILTLGGNDILRGIEPEVAEANLRAMLEICREKGLEVLLVGVPVAANYGADYKAAFEAIWPGLAQDFDVAYYPSFLGPLGTDPVAALAFMQEDGIHPNPEGVRRIVDGIGPEVLAMVGRIRAR